MVNVLPIENPQLEDEGNLAFTSRRAHRACQETLSEAQDSNNRPLVAQVLDNEDGTYTVSAPPQGMVGVLRCFSLGMLRQLLRALLV